MNALYLGLKKDIKLPKGGFLFIGDEVPNVPRARIFDPLKHSFNPLKRIGYADARRLADVLYTLYPQGENTLTVRNGRRALLQAFLTTTRLDKLKTRDDEALATASDLLASPVLRNVLCTPRKDDPGFSFSPNSKILARINRAEIGDFDALALGLFLINRFQGQLVIPDFGFYGRDAHISLVRAERLIAGVNFLDELPLRLRNALLLIKDKHPSRTTHKDAEILAEYEGYVRNTNEHGDYLNRAME